MRRAASALFLLGVALLPVMHPLQVHLLGSVLIPADVCLILAGAAWLLAAARREVPVRWGRFPVAVACYLVVVAVGAARAGNTGALNHLIIAFYVCGVGLLVYNLVPVHLGVDTVVKAWLIGAAIAVVLALVGVLLFYAGLRDNFAVGTYGNVPSGQYPRLISVFLNPNMFCNYLIVSAVLLIGAFERGWLTAVQFGASISALGVALVFTLSPGLGDAGFVVVLWAWASPNRLRPPLRRVAIVVGAAVAAGFAVLTCVSLHSTSRAVHASPRVHVWQQAGTAFVHHLPLGVGLAGHIARVRIVQSGHVDYATDAHNTWLSIGAQLGVLGVVAFGAVLVVAVGQWPSRLEADPIRKALLIAAIGTFLYEGLSMSVQDFRQAWLLLGLLAAVSAPRQSGHARSRSVAGRGVASSP